jgi:hypothetical protein
MSLALYTTTITVHRTALEDVSGRDPWEPDTPIDPAPEETTIATQVPADISLNLGRSGGPGDTETVEFQLLCDPTDLSFRDTVSDDTTGAVYEVQWATLTPGLPGFEHVQAGLKQVSGFGNA